MRFIADLKDEELLPKLYEITDDVTAYVKEIGLAEIRKTMPTEGVTVKEQAIKNLLEMMKRLCADYPKETARILRKLWVLEDGEKEEDKPNVLITISRFVSEEWLIDFFTSAMKLMN